MIKMKHAMQRWAAIAPVAALAAMGLVYVFNSPSGLGMFLLALVAAGLAVNCLFNLIDSRLARRAKANAPVTWVVWMNDVKIGTVTDAEYASIQCLALHDIGNAIAQLLNVGRVVMVLAKDLFYGIPLGVTWSVIVWTAIEPDVLIIVVRWFLKADSAEVVQWVRAVAPYVLLVTAVLAAAMAGMGYRFGFRNCYSAAIVKMLRQHFNTPADGDILMERINLQHGLPAPQFGYAND
ncbi:hypothetical protein HFK85_22340 [Ralstonia pseudosolanacearum]|uniref:hypothetical protein n=1 Tax=Ralstonia pseudosolanacearum TaxID=1310165 RepID=UPI002005365A|nr:hypothetical protein [Ralstonia pseudosolanacearum]MCK4140083.1 hypothetical protein [Ralstonia pseudosolanacearum]